MNGFFAPTTTTINNLCHTAFSRFISDQLKCIGHWTFTTEGGGLYVRSPQLFDRLCACANDRTAHKLRKVFFSAVFVPWISIKCSSFGFERFGPLMRITFIGLGRESACRCVTNRPTSADQISRRKTEMKL